jgi:glycosyltransferase involved in cell wall biosynthesis
MDNQSISGEVVWIDWGEHTRTRSLTGMLGIPLVEITGGHRRLARYLSASFQTLQAIVKFRPKVVIATNPSIVLGYLLLLVRGILAFRLVADAHYFGVVAPNGNAAFQWALDRYNQKADLVIVTNDAHAQMLRQGGARTFVCPDPLPSLAHLGPTALIRGKSVFLVCSFDKDEPFEAAFTAFQELQSLDIQLFVSGDFSKAGINPKDFGWISFLGYLSLQDYQRCLDSCDVVMDLTSLENCLVCGAYEALAAGKPLILSNSRALRDYFGSAVVLTENSPDAIRASVVLAFENLAALSDKAKKWVAENAAYMAGRVNSLTGELMGLEKKSGANDCRLVE